MLNTDNQPAVLISNQRLGFHPWALEPLLRSRDRPWALVQRDLGKPNVHEAETGTGGAKWPKLQRDSPKLYYH